MTGSQKKKLQYIFYIAAITFIVYLLYRFFLPFVIPFVFAYWIARLLTPMVDFSEKHIRLPRMIGNPFFLFLFFSLLGTGVYLLLRTLMGQVDALLRNIPIYQQFLATSLKTMCHGCDEIFHLSKGATHQFLTTNLNQVTTSIKTEFMPAFTEQALDVIVKTAGFLGCLFFIFLSSLFLLKDLPIIQDAYRRSPFYPPVHTVLGTLNHVLSSYFRMQGIITSINAIVCTLGLILIKNGYALLLGIFIAVFDAFPILGSGLIFIPWGLFQLLAGNIFQAAVLFTLYALCQLIRQTLEPRLLGSRIGILPIYTIISIYIGMKLYGIVGVFLGPLSLVTIQTVLSALHIKGPSAG